MQITSVKVVSLLFASLFSASGLAQATVTPTTSNGIKVGVVDVQKIILTSEEGKAERTKLENEVKKKETELKGLESKLEAMAKEVQSQAALMTPQAREAKQKEFQTKLQELQTKKMQFGAEVKRKEQEATQKIAKKVALVVENIAKEKNIELVFEANSSGLMFVKNPVDLTADVMKLYTKGSVKSAKK